MTDPSSATTKCTRCGIRPATELGVPIEASLRTRPDGTPLRQEVMFRVEPETWLRLCEPCVTDLIKTGALAAVFDLATWRDPRHTASD